MLRLKALDTEGAPREGEFTAIGFKSFESSFKNPATVMHKQTNKQTNQANKLREDAEFFLEDFITGHLIDKNVQLDTLTKYCGYKGTMPSG